MMLPLPVDKALRRLHMADELIVRKHLLDVYARLAAAEGELASLQCRVTAPDGWHATLVMTPEAVTALTAAALAEGAR